MEVKINVDETMFKDVIEKELNAFTKEEVHDIIRNGLIQIMSNKETFKDLFVVEKDGWCSRGEVEASKVLKEAAKTIDFSPLFEQFQKDALEYIKTNESKIFHEMMVQIFVSGLSHSLEYPISFTDNIKNSMLGMFQLKERNE